MLASRTKIALVVGVLLTLGLLLLWRGGRGGAPTSAVAPPSVERASEQAGRRDDAPQPELEPEGPSTSARALELAPTTGEPGSGASADGGPAGLARLRGVLRRSDDGAPATDARLAFFFGGDATQVVTDAEGRFETERVLPPGSVRVGHQSDRARPDYALALPVEPHALLVPAPDAAGETPPVELRLVLPEAWLELRVLRPDGGGAAGAEVETALAALGEARAPFALATLTCDEAGRARLGVRGGVRAALCARRGALVSELVELVAPWPGAPVELRLAPGAELRVQLLDEAAQPVAKRTVNAALLGRDDFLVTPAGETDDSGSVRFVALPSGRYRATTWSPELRERVSAEIELAAGEPGELTLAVPRLALELAAAGRVLDESGAPLGDVELDLEHESGAALSTRTDAAGRFEFRAAPCGVVTVALDRDPWGDEYEPARRRVAFGERALEFRRRSTAAVEELLLELVDARTGARVRGGAVMVHRAPHLGDYAMYRADEGLAALRFKALDGIAFGVAAPGYRRRYVPRGEVLPGGEGAQARVALERGFERVLRVRDEAGPVADAEVKVGERVVARADGEGLARVDLPEWPAELLVTAPGREPARAAPEDFLWDLGPAVIELEERR